MIKDLRRRVLDSLRQQHTDNTILGRVRSAWLVVTALGTLCGIVVGGQLAEMVGLRDTLFFAVGIRLVVVLLAMLSAAEIAQATTPTAENTTSSPIL